MSAIGTIVVTALFVVGATLVVLGVLALLAYLAGPPDKAQ